MEVKKVCNRLQESVKYYETKYNTAAKLDTRILLK
jgi:hypothetical protein